MANKPTEEQRQLLRQLEELIGNPMNALDVYAPFKRFEEYFILTVFGNLNVQIQRSYGKTITDEILKCRVLLPKCQFGTRTSKLAATVDFLNAFATILGCIEFIILHNVGVSINQGAELVMLIKEIRSQMGGFRKYLENSLENCQNPEPTGEGSEQVKTKGSPALM